MISTYNKELENNFVFIKAVIKAKGKMAREMVVVFVTVVLHEKELKMGDFTFTAFLYAKKRIYYVVTHVEEGNLFAGLSWPSFSEEYS